MGFPVLRHKVSITHQCFIKWDVYWPGKRPLLTWGLVNLDTSKSSQFTFKTFQLLSVKDWILRLQLCKKHFSEVCILFEKLLHLCSSLLFCIFFKNTFIGLYLYVRMFLNWGMCVLIAQSRPTLCDPMDCSPPGSSVHGIFQASILEWVAISFSRDLPNQGTNPGLLHCSRMLYSLSY